jgi:single-strand DNA-binding protein
MIISGICRLGRDAELRYIPSGTAVCNLALAFNYGQKQQDGGRLSQWVECSLWGKQAEALAQYLKKGNQVSVTAEGPHIEFFTKQDGTQQSKLVANIINLELIPGQNQQQGQQSGGQQPQQRPQQRPEKNESSLVDGSIPVHDNFDAPYNDDIPF